MSLFCYNYQVKLLLVNNLEPEDIAFNEPLRESLSRFASLDSIYYFESPPEYLHSNYDGIVISGAPLHYDIQTLHARLPHLQWVKGIDIPVLGICLAHQNIALMYGAHMIIDDESEDSAVDLIIKKHDRLLDGITSHDKMMARHSCSVSLPKDFTLLASTTRCRNQVMRHVEKHLYTVQFHPELTKSGVRILKNFAHIADLNARNTR